MPRLTPKEMEQARKEYHRHKHKFQFVRIVTAISKSHRRKYAEWICECGKLKKIGVK